MGFVFNGLSGQEVSIEINTSTIGVVGAVTGLRAYSAAGTTTLGTVPANKIWYITGIEVGASAQNVGHSATVSLNAVVFARSSPSSTTFTATDHFVSFPYPFAAPKLTAGQTATLTTEANVNGWATVHYVEVTAP